MSGASLRFFPSSESSSTHSSGNMRAMMLGMSPLKMAFRAYCVAVGRMLQYRLSSQVKSSESSD